MDRLGAALQDRFGGGVGRLPAQRGWPFLIDVFYTCEKERLRSKGEPFLQAVLTYVGEHFCAF